MKSDSKRECLLARSAIPSRKIKMQAAKIRAGQAMVELAVGLLAMMALLGALIQIGRLEHARSRTMMEARAIYIIGMSAAIATLTPEMMCH